MSSIPLPALDIRPPQQQQDPIESMGRLLQMRNLMAQQKLIPGQLQEQQNQIQAGQQENQQRQLQLQDQQAMTQAMHEWDGKDLNELPSLILKHGGSANAVFSTKNQVLSYQKNLADMDKTTLENTKTKNDYIAQAIDNVKSVSPEQQPQAFEQAKADLVQKGYLDPQSAQGLQYQGPQQLDMLEKTFMGHSAAIDAASKQAQANEAVTNAKKSQAELDYYAKNGGAPGVPTETTEMNSWLQQNPGKTPADFLKFKATLVPQFNFNLQNAGTTGNAADVAKRFGLTPAAFDQQAERYWSTGQLPPVGRGGPSLALNKAIMNHAAELHPGGSLAANSAEYKANSESLKKFQTQFDSVNAFENTAGKNIDRLLQTAQSIPDLGSRFANVPIRMINEKMIGTDQMARFKADLLTAQNESAKVLNSANMTGVLSDSARKELQDLANGNLSYGALKGAFAEIENDMGNRKQSYLDQINDIKLRLGDKSATQTAPQQQFSGQGTGQPQSGAAMTRIKASDGSLHDIPTANLGKAKQIDPGLQVIQ